MSRCMHKLLSNSLSISAVFGQQILPVEETKLLNCNAIGHENAPNVYPISAQLIAKSQSCSLRILS